MCPQFFLFIPVNVTFQNRDRFKLRTKTKSLAEQGFLVLAEAVGFEPTGDFTRHSISSRDRYDHFDTPPYGKHEREAELSNARYYTIKNLKKQPFFEKKLEIIFADARKSFCVSEKGIFLFNLNF